MRAVALARSDTIGMANDTTTKILFTPNQLAAKTGLCRHRIRRAIRDGKLRASQPGTRRFYVRMQDFEAWLASHAVVPDAGLDAEVERDVDHQLRSEAEL